MRQLFLPACICLVTWSGATSSDTGLTLDEFTSRRHISSEQAPVRLASLDVGDIAASGETPRTPPGEIGITHEEDASAVVAIPREDSPPPSARDIAALVPNLPAEFPVPSGKVINNGIPAGIPLPPVPKPVVDRSEEEVCNALAQAAQRNDVPAPFLIRLLFQESKFRPEVVSAAGAQGIAQFMPGTADEMGVDNPYDPLQAIPASARMLGNLVRQFGNLGLAAAAYNAGPKRVADWLAAKGKSKLPDETQGYVKTITGNAVENWSAASARHPAQKIQQAAPCQSAAGLLAANGPDALPLPSPSPLRATVKVADKSSDKPGDDKKTAKAEHKPPVTKVAENDKAGAKLAEIKKPGAANKALDIKIVAPEPQPAKKNGRLALGAKVVHRADARAELKLDVKPQARTEAKAAVKTDGKAHKAQAKPEPHKEPAKREKIAQR
ncbi:MAG: transglycosylase SLT domain-containing protein [Proteobacteria bacterium]|nr:transglycosylase SLT domain-containing protein [Pseudomonadota bacterium]